MFPVLIPWGELELRHSIIFWRLSSTFKIVVREDASECLFKLLKCVKSVQ